MVSSTTKQKYTAAGPAVTRASGVRKDAIKIIITKISTIDQRPTDSVKRYSHASRIWLSKGRTWAEYSNTIMAMILTTGTATLALK